MKHSAISVALGVVVTALFTTTSHANTFLFDLFNHPDGVQAPPRYGLRLDELFNVGGGNDAFTFDFNERAGTGMKLMYSDGGGTAALTDDTIRIWGRVYGGLDTGSGYGNSDYAGYWDIDFTYRSNIVSAVDQAEVGAESIQNNGWIKPLFDVGGNSSLNGQAISMWDKQGHHPYSFKFNNTDDHRLGGHDVADGTYAGWGWLQREQGPHGDWLFTGQQATDPVPEPATIALFGLGLTGAAVMRRRKKAQAR